MDSVGAATTLAAVAAVGMWEGAALYGLTTAVPYYNDPDQPTGELLNEWRRFFPPAMEMQKRLVILATAACGAVAYANEGAVRAPFAAAAAANISIFAYTMAKIMPVNRQLLPKGEVEKRGDATARELLQAWGRMHGVRTLMGGVSLAATLCGLHMLLTKK